MKENIKSVSLKHRQLIAYILVGGGTTVVAWTCKYLCNLFLFGSTAFPTLAQNTVLSFVENMTAIVYAYPANRKWVFQSKNPNILEELMKFTGSRAVVWLLGWLLNMVLVNVFGVHVYLSTVLAGLVCVNVNFVLSKLLIFDPKKNRQRSHPAEEHVTVFTGMQKDADLDPAA